MSQIPETLIGYPSQTEVYEFFLEVGSNGLTTHELHKLREGYTYKATSRLLYRMLEVGYLRRTGTFRDKSAVFVLDTPEEKENVVKAPSINRMIGVYKCPELADFTDRPGAMKAYSLPSLIGNKLHYRDGTIQNKP